MGATGGPGAGSWGRSHRRLTTGPLLTVIEVAFEALAVTTAMPATVADLGGLAWYGWVFSAFGLTNLIGVVLAGVALFAGGLLVGGLAPTMPALIGGRA